MKTAKIFLFLMYGHLILSIIVPLVIFFLSKGEGWTSTTTPIFMFYILMIFVTQVVGWACVLMAIRACRREEGRKLRHSLKLLKIYSIPFYLINFVYSCLFWLLMLAATRGMIFFLLVFPVLVTWTMVFQTGCVGICYVRYLRRFGNEEKRPGFFHYIFQIFFLTDVISAAILLKKYKKGDLEDRSK